jgi:hypothetical protein
MSVPKNDCQFLLFHGLIFIWKRKTILALNAFNGFLCELGIGRGSRCLWGIRNQDKRFGRSKCKHCAMLTEETLRTSVEIVDAFAVSYLVLISLFPDYVAWSSRVLERYLDNLDSSREAFHKAQQLRISVSSHEALLIRIHELKMHRLLSPDLVDLDERLDLLKHWMKFLNSKLVSAKWVLVSLPPHTHVVF